MQINAQDFAAILAANLGTSYNVTLTKNPATGDLEIPKSLDTSLGTTTDTATTNPTSNASIIALLKGLLTEAQLKADLTEPQPVGATIRTCVSHQPLTIPATTGVTLASLCSGGVLPTGAITCEIQAQNGIVRYRLDASTVTPTTGAQINVSETYVIDSVLASVRVVAESTAVSCSAKFFDKV